MQFSRGIAMASITVLFTYMALATLDESLRFLAVWTHRHAANQQAPVRNVALYIDHPFLTYLMKPNYEGTLRGYAGNNGGTWRFHTNSRGFRTPEFSIRKPAGTYRIVVIGGSAVATASDTAHLFTQILMNQLNRRANGGPRYEVINAGVPGWQSTQELFLAETEVISWDPDMVIVYDGFNDVLSASRAGYRPNWHPRNFEVMAAVNDQIHQWSLDRQVYLYHLILGVRQGVAGTGSRRTEAHPEGIPVYAANLRSLVSVLKDRGIIPVLVFQPVLSQKARWTEQERRVLSLDRLDLIVVLRQLIPLAEQAALEVGHAEHVPTADFTHILDRSDEAMYTDVVHQTDRGNVVIADQLLQLISPLLRSGASFRKSSESLQARSQHY